MHLFCTRALKDRAMRENIGEQDKKDFNTYLLREIKQIRYAKIQNNKVTLNCQHKILLKLVLTQNEVRLNKLQRINILYTVLDHNAKVCLIKK